jgi:dolichyl-phosphate-mannose--protein O-mannosyl transferase
MKSWRAPLILFLLGLILRLPILETPRQVVFDEVHFGKFALAYVLTGERFFDLHPPHTKLLMAASLKLSGVKSVFDFAQIGKDYPEDFPVWGLRIVPALAGAAVPAAAWWMMTTLGLAGPVALLGGLFLALDNALWVHSRFGLLDSVQMLFGLLAVGSLAAALGARSFVRRSFFTGFAGLFLGFVLGAKFTGLALLVPLSVLALFPPPGSSSRMSTRLVLSGITVLIGTLVYVAGWWLHFKLLPHDPAGYDWYKPQGSLVTDILKLQKIMLAANNSLSSGHPDASSAWVWPLMARPVFYWVGPDRVIYLLGNPVVWLGALAATLISWTFLLRHVWFESRARGVWKALMRPAALVPLSAWIASWTPLMLLQRPMFLYHWLIPLGWLICFAAAGAAPFLEKRLSSRIVVICLGCLVFGFLVALPFTSGWPILPELRAMLVSRLLIFHL